MFFLKYDKNVFGYVCLYSLNIHEICIECPQLMDTVVVFWKNRLIIQHITKFDD